MTGFWVAAVLLKRFKGIISHLPCLCQLIFTTHMEMLFSLYGKGLNSHYFKG